MKVQFGTGRYFNTENSITLVNAPSGLVRELFSMCARYDRLFTRYAPGSDIWRINNAGGAKVQVDPETVRCISIGLDITKRSGGAFDMTVGTIKDYWSFKPGSERVAQGRELAPALGRVRDIEVSGNSVRVAPGVGLDLGGIAKGYVADRLAERVLGEGCAGSLIDLGGNIYVTGVSAAGGLWRIAIHDPQAGRDKTAACLELTDLSVVTSSASERSFERGGKIYHHILDPGTGMPAAAGLSSVTVVAESSAIADAAATAAFVMGRDRAKEFLSAPDIAGYFLITSESSPETGGNLFFTRNINKEILCVRR